MPDKDVIIIGGGISGLSALHFLRQLHPDLSVTLYEADNRLGGTIGTDHVDGYSLDWGPNGFLDREPLTLRLVDELGLVVRRRDDGHPWPRKTIGRSIRKLRTFFGPHPAGLVRRWRWKINQSRTAHTYSLKVD